VEEGRDNTFGIVLITFDRTGFSGKTDKERQDMENFIMKRQRNVGGCHGPRSSRDAAYEGGRDTGS
jgi:hypothetical protein